MATRPVKKKQLYEMIRKVNEGNLAASQRLFNGKRMVMVRLPVIGVSLSIKSLRPIVCKPK